MFGGGIFLHLNCPQQGGTENSATIFLTWIQNMTKSVPNMVRNGLEKEGAKSENFVVEPDLLTTNLDPKYVQIGSEYGPERSQKRGCKI